MFSVYLSFITRLAITTLLIAHLSLQEILTNPLLQNKPRHYWHQEISYQTPDPHFELPVAEQDFCNQLTTEFVGQFQSVPLGVGPMSCSFTMQAGPSTCGIRVDFLDTLTAASINKICYQDIIMIINHGNSESFNTPICGDLQGYSTVLKVQEFDKIQVFVLLQKPESKWNIRLTQVKCESVILRASDACGFRNGRKTQSFTHRLRSQRINSRWLTESRGVKDEIHINSLYYWHASVVKPGYESSNDDQYSKIISGSPSTPNEFPWIALILLENELHCTGSLLNHRWIVTAAHCTSSSRVQSPSITDYSVALGVHNRALLQEQGRILRDVSNIIRHPQYEGIHFDIALLQINESVRYNHAVRPICLPEPDETYLDREIGIVAGWGSTDRSLSSDVMLSGPIPFVNASYCRYVWHKLGVEITDSIICAGLSGSTTCEGDSGSPLVLEEHGLYRIVGITSSGASPACGSAIYPDVFTRVASLVDWITLALLDVGVAE